MAEPIDFEQAQYIWKGEGDVENLPVYQEDGLAISCWELTPEEVKCIVDTGKVWLRVWTNYHPPVNVSGENPWEQEVGDG